MQRIKYLLFLLVLFIIPSSTNAEAITANPSTGDNVMMYVTILVICVVGIAGIFIFKKVSKK